MLIYTFVCLSLSVSLSLCPSVYYVSVCQYVCLCLCLCLSFRLSISLHVPVSVFFCLSVSVYVSVSVSCLCFCRSSLSLPSQHPPLRMPVSAHASICQSVYLCGSLLLLFLYFPLVPLSVIWSRNRQSLGDNRSRSSSFDLRRHIPTNHLTRYGRATGATY